MALNRRLDAEAARKIVEIFTEVIIAPDADPEAIEDRRGEEEPAAAAGGRPARSASAPGLTVRSVAGGLLVQDRDNGALDAASFKVVTQARAERSASCAICDSPGGSAST